MKPWFILIGLSVSITAAATIALPYFNIGSEARGPDLVAPPRPDGPSPEATILEDLKYDFGVLPQQYFGNHSWTFKNTGAGPLELRGTSTSCSCTTSDLFEDTPPGQPKVGKLKVVQPGESLAVGVKFETRTWDHYHQNVTLATNDPQRPQVVLMLEGKVRPAISTLPPDPSINFPAVSNEEPTVARTFLFSSDRPDVKLLRLVSSKPELIDVKSRIMTPEEAKFAKVEKGYVIETTVKPSANLGAFVEEVLIETDHPQKSELKFTVRGKVSGPITVLPEKVSMRNATTTKGGSEVLTLWARGRTSIQFVVEKKPDGMDVAIEPLPTVEGLKGSKYKMTVTLAPGADSGRISGEIFLKPDDPKVTELRVPVEVLVQGAN
jgi:Protein of unknown function (DUF1573)